MKDGDELLKVGEAAKYLTVSSQWLYEHTELIKPVRFGRAYRWLRSDLDAFIADYGADAP